MSFLSNLGKFGSSLLSAVNEQFTPGNLGPRTLDTSDPSNPHRTINFGFLGDYASQIDNTALRSYVETGSIRNIRPRNLEVLMQEPDLTVVIKKRLFSSLVDNYRLDLMDSADKTFFRASKKLFQNKCQAISIYEKLSKIEKIVQNKGVLDDFMIPAISSGIDALDNLGVNILDPKTRSVFETLRRLNNLSEPSQTTTWILDKDSSYFSELGEGTGVFELTLVAQVNTTVSTEFGSGRASLTIEDPYKLMTVTEEDIEFAISESVSFFSTNNLFRVADRELNRIIQDDKKRLSDARLRRGAPPIRFLISDDSILYNRVRAIIDEAGTEILFTFDPGVLGFGSDVEIDSNFLSAQNVIDGNSVVPNGVRLDQNEASIFKDIIKNIFQSLNQKRNTRTQIQDFSSDENLKYVRDKMMLHYAGKNIIQPMDIVHIFVSSKTQIDNKVIGFRPTSIFPSKILSNLNNSFQELKNTYNNFSGFFGGGQKDTFLEIEKQAIVGADFPTWLWMILKNDFTKQTAGIQIFQGITDVVQSTYDASSGKYIVNVSINDNTHYFKLGQINLKPSVDVFNSALYDPLTPFKLDFDASSGFLRGEFPDLLEENVRILLSPNVKFKNGRFKGGKASRQSYQIKSGERTNASNALNFRQILTDPDGFVYRWKSGIGSLTKFGEPHPASSLEIERSPALTVNPFAGQDVMNVLSLLITGRPYNYNTFVLAGIQSGNLSKNDLTNEAGPVSFYRGLLSDLKKQNLVWGNFVPFKQQIINEKGLSFLMQGQFDTVALNNDINKLLDERARLFDALVLTPDGAQFANNPQTFPIGENFDLNPQDAANTSSSSPAIQAAKNIRNIDEQIEKKMQQQFETIRHPNLSNGNLKIFGDDVSFDPNVFEESGTLTEEERVKARREFRRKLNLLTQRRLWKVKSNEDVNLLVVDDQYDKNLDIQSFEKALAGKLNLLQSEYGDIFGKIPQVAQLLGLEVFADSQGHIKIRPPGYNKVPSSVFYQMLKDASFKGKRVFPKILERLFINQLEGLIDHLEITEDEIRLRAAALGFGTDNNASSFITNGGDGNNSGSNYTFKFVTDERTGKFGTSDIRNVIDQSNPDIKESSMYRPLKDTSSFQAVSGQLKLNKLFDITKKISAFSNPVAFQNISNDADEKAAQIRSRLERLKGVKVPSLAELFSSDRARNTKQTEVLNVVNDISRLVSERQSILKLLSNAMKNLDQGLAINNDPNAAKELLFPSLGSRKTEIPSLLEHMIEDEETDDLGTGSGGRYIIKENQILSLSIREQPPTQTIVEVNGLFGEGFVQAPSSLALSNSPGGNAITTAFAVDYDLWRMYGFKAGQPTMVPSLSDPDSQLAPFAVFLLNRARKNIFQATLSIVGNEFMQAGEVVYIEDRNLLFYIESVSHSFSYSGSFTTTLELRYGHTPGEYIPTMLDMVGKALYSKRHQSNLIRHVRHGHSSNEVPITTLAIDNRLITEVFEISPLKRLVGGSFGIQNRKNLANIIFAASGALTPNSNKTPKIELRVYHNSNVGISADSTLLDTANEVKNWLIRPSKVVLEDDIVLSDNLPEGFNISEDQVEVIQVDSVDVKSPSSEAWSMARGLVNNSSNSISSELDGLIESGDILEEDKVLFTNIIDIWIVFEDVDPSLSTSRSKSSITSEDVLNKAQELKNKIGG